MVQLGLQISVPRIPNAKKSHESKFYDPSLGGKSLPTRVLYNGSNATVLTNTAMTRIEIHENFDDKVIQNMVKDL